MKLTRPVSDAQFFAEWEEWRGTKKRSLHRTELLICLLDVHRSIPKIAIVGSKGKGSTAAALTMSLVNSGLMVGTVISPAYRTNRERIRMQGKAISESDYAELANDLERIRKQLPPITDGYLSPSGAYLSMALKYFENKNVDVIIMEEGMGGKSDEISLLDFDLVVLTNVFLEHLGKIGDNLSEIAGDLLGVISIQTKYLVADQQDKEVETIISKINTTRIKSEKFDLVSNSDIPAALKSNFQIAATAAKELLQDYFPDKNLKPVVKLNLPGRYMFINNQLTGNQNWFIDASNNPEALQLTLNYLRDINAKPNHAFVCFSNQNNREAGLKMLSDVAVTEVLINNPQSSVAVDESKAVSVSQAISMAKGIDGLVMFLGTNWYVANILETLDVNTENWA